jgi:uncharacterized protein YqgC (DUF456 family)
MPALSYMLLVAITFGLLDHFKDLSLNNLFVLIGIWAVSVLIDHLSGILGAKWGGASKRGLIYGFVGLLIGTAILPPFGGFLGLFGGVLFSELLANRKSGEAVKAATGSLIGSIMGVAVNTILAVIFFLLFIYFLLW